MGAPVDFEPRYTPLPRNRWWHRLQAEPAACIRLWCFPSIGAGTAIWRPWLPPLRGAGDVISVCLPGREARFNEAPHARFETLIDSLVHEMAATTDERDVFCGHGFGAWLAYELARALHAAGAPGPRGLVVAGAPPPHEGTRGSLHRHSPRAFLRLVERRYGAIPVEFHNEPEFLELLLPSLRADLEAMETHRHREAAPLDVPLLALTGTADRLAGGSARDGWRGYTTSRFETDRVPGGHFVFTENPLGSAQRVRRFLATL